MADGPIAFELNGRRVATEADARTPLLDVLRESLGLSGPRFGCGEGECGACTALVDGVRTTSCGLALDAVEGRRVVTVEGLGTPDAPHPLQRAFLDERAAQCGYCVSGILCTAAALLEREPRPTHARIAQALDRHLCRCGAQPRMLRAVRRAAGLPTEPPDDADHGDRTR